MKVELKSLSTWMHRNAREVELLRWKYHFEGGSKIAVVEALCYFQNENGGFGYAVDADNWNTESVPYSTGYVLNILKEIEFIDITHPVYQGIIKYLENTGDPERWIFTIPSNDNFPCAAFYKYNEKYNKTESIGICVNFMSFILQNMQGTAVYEKVLTILPKYMDLIWKDELGDMGTTGYIHLISVMKKLQISRYDYQKLEERLNDLVYQGIERDLSKWQYYGYRPSDYIKGIDSLFYERNKDIIEKEIDYLGSTLPNNDVWPITWSWFENNDQYPKEQAISDIWGKSYKCIERALFLRGFDALI